MAIEFPANPASQTPLNTFSPDSTPLASPNDVTYTWDGVKWEAYKKLDPSDFDDLFVEVAGDDMTGNLTLGTDKIVLNAGDGSITAVGRVSGFDALFGTCFANRFSTSDNTSTVLAAGITAGSRISFETGGINRVLIEDDVVKIGGATVIDTAPTITLEANGSGTFDGDIQSTSQNGGQLAGFRNQIINGNLNINQRGATSGTIAGTGFGLYQSLDRWATSNGAQWESSSAVADLPSNGMFTRSLRLTNSESAWRQAVELPMVGRQAPFISGSQFTFSVYAQGEPTYAGLEFRLSTGGDVEESVTAPSLTVVEGPDGNGFSRYAHTFTLGNYSLTSAACVSLTVSYPINSYWTGVQLEPGPVATPYEHRPIQTELALCQRYFQKLTLAAAAVTMGNDFERTARIPERLSVKMRATPTSQNLVQDSAAIATTQSGTTRTMPAPSMVAARSDDLIEASILSDENSLETLRYVGATVELDAEL